MAAPPASSSSASSSSTAAPAVATPAPAPAAGGESKSERKQLPLIFVTGNQNKLREVRAILGDHVINKNVDLPELQGEPAEISSEKCRLAAKEVKGPVIVEDTSLCFNALHGLPGPYIKWFLDKTGHEGLNNLLAAYPDKTGYAQCIFSFSQGPGHTPIVFDGRCPGTIVPARGPPQSFGWDPIFQPDGQTLTFAEMDAATKNRISHRSLALAKLRTYLAENPTVLDAPADAPPAAAAPAEDGVSHKRPRA